MNLEHTAERFLDIVMTKKRDEHGLVRAILTCPDYEPIDLAWSKKMGRGETAKWTNLPESATLMYGDANWCAGELIISQAQRYPVAPSAT